MPAQRLTVDRAVRMHRAGQYQRPGPHLDRAIADQHSARDARDSKQPFPPDGAAPRADQRKRRMPPAAFSTVAVRPSATAGSPPRRAISSMVPPRVPSSGVPPAARVEADRRVAERGRRGRIGSNRPCWHHPAAIPGRPTPAEHGWRVDPGTTSAAALDRHLPLGRELGCVTMARW